MGKLQGRIERDFTVIHNDFIRDERLGLDELGMLLKLMSLPEDWDFSIAGLAKIVANGKHKVTSALNKLKKYGYFRRIREIDPKTGRVIDWIYEFSDQPHPEWITTDDEEIVDTPVAEADEPEHHKEENADKDTVAESADKNKSVANDLEFLKESCLTILTLIIPIFGIIFGIKFIIKFARGW